MQESPCSRRENREVRLRCYLHLTGLGEIECHIRTYLKNVNAVCVAYSNSKDIDEIAAFIEMKSGDTKNMVTFLKSKMPAYMIPTKVIYVSHFPLNANGKIDRNSLKKLIK